MNPQIIRDNDGKNTGVFITIEDWNLIESTYPDISSLSNDIPQWQKDILNIRLNSIAADPNRIKPVDHLFDLMKKDF